MQHPLNLGGIPSHFTPCPIYPTPFLKNFLRLHATVPCGKRLLNFQNEVWGDTFFFQTASTGKALALLHCRTLHH